MEFIKVLGAFLLLAVVRGGHLDQSAGYGGGSYAVPAVSSSYGAPGGGYTGVSSYAAPASGGYNAGYNNGGSSYAGAGYQSGGHGAYDEQPKSYQFGYAVKDYATGNDYHRHETSDGNTIQGEYRVQLPDGRTQIVSYTADWKNGYRAQVRYEGEAQYPTNYGAPSPAHTGASFGGSSYSGHGGSNPGYGGYDAGHGYSGSPSGVSSSYGPPGYGK
ncbi:pro-resilin-like [Periplaneta americana]|uniref:pro-resilin-like n=1 Tax=Periplaneta americana TaxID=6978 RepID=UPI0037E71DC1